jgi:hypothetical protein
MFRPSTSSAMSETARSLRASARLALGLCLVSAAIAFGGMKGWLPPPIGLAFRPLALATAILSVWLGTKAHRRALADREMEGARAMIVVIAAQLGKQPDETLERIRVKGGPAGEAAGMILQGRREKAARQRQASGLQADAAHSPAPPGTRPLTPGA